MIKLIMITFQTKRRIIQQDTDLTGCFQFLEIGCTKIRN